MENLIKHYKTYVLDRFEGEYGVLEDKYGKLYDVLRKDLPENVREGDILYENEGVYLIDEEATRIRREEIRRIRESLMKNS